MKSSLTLSDEEHESEKQRIIDEIKTDVSQIVVDPDGYYLYDNVLSVLDTTVRLLWLKEHEKKRKLSDEERRLEIDSILKDLSGGRASGTGIN